MRGIVSVLSIALLLTTASFVMADDSAATSQLPASLQALGVSQDSVVSQQEAHQVRGRTFYLLQHKDFDVNHGVATGSTSLLEGVFGQFESIDFQNGGEGGDSITIMGTFGGLTGSLNQTSNGLTFDALGKALSESIDFSGKFTQDFAQSIKIPLP
jgi:hypothetical protein